MSGKNYKDRAAFAKALSREEPGRRTRAYRKKVKKASVRADRRQQRQEQLDV